ncbi:replication initiation protein [Rubrivirga sp. S365]|uniref:replication initiation protein n=1 Tax=unclassified Rubrivirga TaxID=2640460 RepID=UPI0028CA3CF0|nr:replication initiation protein [Rubrivirga sp. S365]MDT7858275.1 replication initiation protein [Rubrivirga sp. S365]
MLPGPLEIKKHVGAIHVKAPLSFLQRKAANVLLLNAYDELPDESVIEHSIKLTDLAEAVGFNSKNSSYLREALETLVETKVVWNVLDAEGREGWGASGLLAQAYVEPGSGTCQYAYSPRLRALLYNPAIYSRINLTVQTRFSSGTALALYENCLRFLNVGTTGWIDVGDWRGLLGVGEDQYTAFSAFNQKVLARAVKQVNAHSDIRIEMEKKKEGRQIAALRFKVTAAPAFETASLPSGDGSSSGRLRLSEFGLTSNQTDEVLELAPEQVERNLAHVEGDLVRGKKIGKLGAYTYRAITEDWAGSTAKGERTQASLFEGAVAGASAQAPPASEVLAGEAARRDREAAQASRLDARIAELDAEARAVLDAEAVRVLQSQPYPGWQEVERAIEGGTESDLGPASGGALRMARRDVVAVWLERGEGQQ